MNNPKNELYDVYSVTLVNWLVQHDHRIIRVADSTNPNHVNQKVFQFRFNKKLKQDVESFKEKRNKCRKIYSLDEANWLISQGFNLIRAENSDQNVDPKYKMFIFEDTEDILTKINEYKGGPRNGKFIQTIRNGSNSE